MPPFGPVKRKDLIRHPKQVGFEGPYSGGRHRFMLRGEITVRVPNPHQSDISRQLLSRILSQAGVGEEEREKL